MLKLRIPVYFLFIFILSSCLSVKPIAIKKIESFKLTELKGNSANIKVTFKISNPNAFRVKVKEYDLEAAFNNQSIGKINIEDKIILKANSEDSYSINIKPDVEKILGILPRLTFTDSSTVSLKGEIKAGVFLFSKHFHVNTRQKISTRGIK